MKNWFSKKIKRPLDEAETRIQAAVELGSDKLDLSGLGLTEVPEFHRDLDQLRELKLHHNRLTALPDWLVRLNQLQILWLDNNQLKALPDWLGELHFLLELSITSNNLTALPESIGGLTQLQVLWAYNNALNSLPDSLGKITALRQLYLHGNNLLGLPPEVIGPTWKDVECKAAKPAKPTDILNCYFSVHKSEKYPLNEARRNLIGHGEVGKAIRIERKHQTYKSSHFEVFISFKNLDEHGNVTRDQAIASQLTHTLTERGISVFFSAETLERLGTSAYKKAIDNALDEAKVLIAVGTSKANLESEWVRYEWDGFLQDIISGVKPTGHVFVVVEGISPRDLPRGLRQSQTFTFLKPEIDKLINFIRHAMT
jgi:Leucine-rich repeat (LRR) protein